MRVLILILAVSVTSFAQLSSNLSVTGSLTEGHVASVSLNAGLVGDVFLLVDLSLGKTVFPVGGGEMTIGLPPTFVALHLGRTNESGEFGFSVDGPSSSGPTEDGDFPTYTLYLQALVLAPKAFGDNFELDSSVGLSQVRPLTVGVPAL